MPMTAAEIASANASSAMDKNRALEKRLGGLESALRDLGIMRQCFTCQGTGEEHFEPRDDSGTNFLMDIFRERDGLPPIRRTKFKRDCLICDGWGYVLLLNPV